MNSLSDHFAVLIGRQPAGDAQHLTVRVHRVQQFDAWIDQLVHATQGEAHFRQGLLAGPLRGRHAGCGTRHMGHRR